MRTLSVVMAALIVLLIVAFAVVQFRYARYSVVKCDDIECTVLDRWTGIVYVQAVPIRK